MRKQHLILAALVLWLAQLCFFGLTPPKPKTSPVYGLLQPQEPASKPKAQVIRLLPQHFLEAHLLARMLGEPDVARLGVNQAWLRKHLHAEAVPEHYLLRLTVDELGPADQATIINACMRVCLRQFDEGAWQRAQLWAAQLLQDAPPGQQAEYEKKADAMLASAKVRAPHVVAWAEP